MYLTSQAVHNNLSVKRIIQESFRPDILNLPRIISEIIGLQGVKGHLAWHFKVTEATQGHNISQFQKQLMIDGPGFITNTAIFEFIISFKIVIYYSRIFCHSLVG